MIKIDLKKLGKQQVSFYLAIEEYLLATFEEDVFFLWDLNPSIIVGSHQLISSEINTQYSQEKGVKIFRRHSGGGAIYADDGCFMFTFTTKLANKDEIFQHYLKYIVNALQKVGIDAYFSGRNDLLFHGKKFSGNAIYKNQNGSLIHGTFLYNTDLTELVKMITPDNEKLVSKGIQSISERVINLKDYIMMEKEEVMEFIFNSINGKIIELTDEQLTLIKHLEQKFLSNKWINGKNPPFDFKNEKRFSWGKIEVQLGIKNHQIKSFVINGDFFPLKELDNFIKQFVQQAYTKETIINILNRNGIHNYILNSNNFDFLKVLFLEE